MKLDEIRTRIDRIDNAVRPLFIKRMECAKHVAEVKAASGGDVYVPEREQAVIGQRSQGVPEEIREEYEAFLKHLMSVCRRYEYGLLDGLKEETVADALARSCLTSDVEHSQVEVRLSCSYEDSDLNLYLNMAKLNHVGVLDLQAEVRDGRQRITMVLEGNVNDEGMKRLLCQMGKEAEDFEICRLTA